MRYEVATWSGNSWSYHTDKVTLPIYHNERLDEGLDLSAITIPNIDEPRPFEIFTKVRIKVWDSDGSVSWPDRNKFIRGYIDKDSVVQTVFGANPKYTHSINVIESTKYTEREIVDTLTVTQPIGKEYYQGTTPSRQTTGTVDIWEKHPAYENVNPLFQNARLYDYVPLNKTMSFNPSIIVENQIISWPNTVFIHNKQVEVTVTAPSGAVVLRLSGNVNYPVQYIQITEQGKYIIQWNYRYDYRAFGLLLGYCSVRSNMEFYSFDSSSIPPLIAIPKTIGGELQRVCDVTPTKRAGEANKWKISADFLAKYGNLECPEFSFTTQTLWETLLQFGNYLHAIPKTTFEVVDTVTGEENWYIIDFEFLGQPDLLEITAPSCALSSEYDSDDYATVLDSTVENVTGMDDNSGSIIHPMEYISQTVRAEEGQSIIEEKTAVFATYEAIQSVEALSITFPYNGKWYTKDITPFCYESAEYNVLSSVFATYPLAKCFALKYTTGKRNISGLAYLSDSAFDPIFTNYAIRNIISKVIGISQAESTRIPINDIMYNIKYTPITDLRIKAHKNRTFEFLDKMNESALVYNQGANAVSANAYGENLDGAITRMANIDNVNTFYTKEMLSIPKIGTLTNNGYISTIDYEFYSDFVKYSITYSKDYNRLSKYIGIKTAPRFYQVSEKNVNKRFISFNSIISVRNDFGVPEGAVQLNNYDNYCDSLINNKGFLRFMSLFIPSYSTSYRPPTLAVLNFFDKDGNLITAGSTGSPGQKKDFTAIGLPLMVNGIGKSIVFKFKCEDNYSAGSSSTSGNVPAIRFMDYARYVDEFGGAEKMAFSFISTYGLKNGIDWGFGNNLPMVDIAFLNDVGASLPPPIVGITTDKNSANPQMVLPVNSARALVIKKDNREALSFCYQIDLKIQDVFTDIIIGYWLSKLNGLVMINCPTTKFALLNKPISKFQKTIDPATIITTSRISYQEQVVNDKLVGVSIYPEDYLEGGKAIAVITDDNKFILGTNDPTQSQYTFAVTK